MIELGFCLVLGNVPTKVSRKAICLCSISVFEMQIPSAVCFFLCQQVKLGGWPDSELILLLSVPLTKVQWEPWLRPPLSGKQPESSPSSTFIFSNTGIWILPWIMSCLHFILKVQCWFSDVPGAMFFQISRVTIKNKNWRFEAAEITCLMVRCQESSPALQWSPFKHWWENPENPRFFLCHILLALGLLCRGDWAVISTLPSIALGCSLPLLSYLQRPYF